MSSKNIVIPLNVPRLQLEFKLLSLKFFCLFYCFVYVFFMICSISQNIGLLKNMKHRPNDVMYNVSLVIVQVFKALNVVMIIYTKYRNYCNRNYFHTVTTKGFMIYFVILPSVTSAGLYHYLILRHYFTLFIGQKTYEFVYQYLLIDVVNYVFLVSVALATIEYSRHGFQAVFGDIAEGEEDRDTILLALLNRYNIIVCIIGMTCTTVDKFVYVLSMRFLDLSSKYYKVEYSNSFVYDAVFMKHMTQFFPCFMLICLTSIFFLVSRIKDYYFAVKKRKVMESMCGKTLSKLRVSSMTVLLGILIFVCTFTSFIEGVRVYAYFTIDSIRLVFEFLGCVTLVMLLVSMKDWKTREKPKPLSEQLFLYFGFVGRLLLLVNYFVIMIIGVRAKDVKKPHFVLGLVRVSISFPFEILLFVFIDISMAKIHVQRSKFERLNLLTILFCLQLALSLISINKYLVSQNIDFIPSMSFIYVLNKIGLRSFGDSLNLLYDVFVAGYCAKKMFKWYGKYKRT